MPDDHVTLPVTLPPLTHLTNEELGSLRNKLSTTLREARRKANQTIGRFEALRKPWSRSLSVHKNTPPDERTEIMRSFERELLRIPEAFLAHAYANALVTLDMACREEILRRPGLSTKKKGQAAPCPPEVKPAPLLEGSDAIMAMFEGVDDDPV